MSNLARTFESIKNIGREERELCFNNLGDDFYPFIRSCFPETDIVKGTTFLKLLLTIYGSFSIKFKEKSSILLPILYLYGPMVIGNDVIMSRNPVIRSEGGTLIDDIRYEKIKAQESLEENNNENFDLTSIEIIDPDQLYHIRKNYEDYIEPLEYVTNLFLEHNLKDRITLSYNIVLNREEFNEKHNILGISEASSNIVWRTLCNNFSRMGMGNRPKYLKFFKDENIKLPKDSKQLPIKKVHIDQINNQMDVPECLKCYGTKNNLVTYEGIYILNSMGYPTGTRMGPIIPHKMKKSEYLIRLLSPHYFKALRDYQYHLYKFNLTSSIVEDNKTNYYPNSKDMNTATEKFLQLKKIRSQVENVLNKSLQDLKNQQLIEETKSSFMIKNRPIYIDDERQQQIITPPSLLEIKEIINDIYKAELDIKKRSIEWQLKS